jgi:HTH-type transcriptional regulator/antitoxin HigA
LVVNSTSKDGNYDQIMIEVKELMGRGVAADSPNGERLADLIGKARSIESARYPRAAPDPISAIRFRMEQQGLQQGDLVPMIGSRARVSEILSGKRQLTLPMIRRLHAGLGIPAESLIAAPVAGRHAEEKLAAG